MTERLEEVHAWKCNCRFCNHTWISNKETIPKCCAKCKKKNWNKEESRNI